MSRRWLYACELCTEELFSTFSLLLASSSFSACNWSLGSAGLSTDFFGVTSIMSLGPGHKIMTKTYFQMFKSMIYNLILNIELSWIEDARSSLSSRAGLWLAARLKLTKCRDVCKPNTRRTSTKARFKHLPMDGYGWQPTAMAKNPRCLLCISLRIRLSKAAAL